MTSAAALAVPISRKAGLPWLFAAPVDVAITLVPAALTFLVALVAAPGAGGAGARATTGWITQFVLGNSTHVILTFLLLRARPDILHATPGQARTVVVGSALTFALGCGLYGVAWAFFPAWSDFVVAVATIFSFQHSFSQAKGIWSLYNLRGKEFGFGPPPPRERSLQQLFVPLALLLVAVRWFFVEGRTGWGAPFFQAVPGMESLLPARAVWALLGVWAVFAAAFVATFAQGQRHGPKLLYLTAHTGIVAMLLFAPVWGAILSSAVHGLEYYALSARMLAPRKEGDAARLRRVGPAMALVMLPLFAVGLLNAPFAPALGIAPNAGYTLARFALNGVVLAHYFADAFIYRFRIPAVRKVALERLGFAA